MYSEMTTINTRRKGGVIEEIKGQKIETAMSRIEVLQRAHYWREKMGLAVDSIISQTGTGQRIIGGQSCTWAEFLSLPRLPKLINCKVCGGGGHYQETGSDTKFRCPVCNGSGICTRNNERHWESWQIEKIMQRRLTQSNQ